MTQEQQILSLQNKKLQLSFWDKLSHFMIVIYFFLLALIPFLLDLVNILKFKTIHAKEAELYFTLICSLIAILLYKLQLDRLKFTEVHTSLSRKQLEQIIENVGRELKWYPEEVPEKFIIAKTHPPFFSGSWGEQITILFDTNRVLVNSICDPEKNSSVASMGRNKRNIKKLIEQIEANSN